MTETTPIAAKDLEQDVWKLMKAGKLQEAAAACDQLNQAFPDYDSGWNTTSRVAINLNEPIIALKAVHQALLISPEKPEWLLQKMACLAVYGDLNAARVIADELASHSFNTAYHASSCAVIMSRLERHEDAVEQYRRAVELNPDNANFRFNLATAQRMLGKVDEASVSLDEALKLNPTDCEAQLLRSGLRTQTENDNNIDSLYDALERIPESHPGRVQLFYALAKEFNDLKRYEESFRNLQQGASERREKIDYDAAQDVRAMAAISEQFDADFFASAGGGFVNAEPIFVVGLPRSGIALVDRILSKHPVVRSIGEAQGFGLQLVEQVQKVKGELPTDTVDLISAARDIDFAELGEAYVNHEKPAGKEIAHFVNKMPNNFMYAGLIHLALPKAKIVLLERDPMDVCYALFKTLFPGPYPYSYDLEELGHYIVAYNQLIAHWHAVMPNVIYTLRYEDLVAESRPVIEGLLGYCDLSFDDDSVNFRSVVEAARSAGDARVRHEFRAKSIGAWKHYAEQLQPVADIFREAGVFEEHV
ncbi:MAG: sulfotransferase [Woeseiaceae bacterium]